MFSRFGYWQVAWEIFRDHWLTGTGPFTYYMISPLYAAPSPPHAHNLYMQTASDTGLIGLTLILAVIFIFYSRVFRLVGNPDPRPGEPVFFLSVAVAGFLIHNLIEYNWNHEVFIFTFTLLVFMVDFIDRKSGHPREVPWLNFRYVLPIFIAGFTVIGTVSIARLYHYDRAIHHELKGSESIEQIAASADKAKTICRRCDRPYMIMALIYLDQYRRTVDLKYLELSKGELQQMNRISPWHHKAFLYLGKVNFMLGNLGEARRAYRVALKDSRFRRIAEADLRSIDKFLPESPAGG